ncbi:hypothetical protein DFH08DRAFT_813672 [Mycena albidolilacea]|uniref:Uncharacterized protein n=1 Tax=Mycena albidolilacea TaxID=1033008 RepID=A0AAD7EKI1_9AGAR|nr:hypothetical protein DFH08DRAFT_813672 [Mycena albidolilacea]
MALPRIGWISRSPNMTSTVEVVHVVVTVVRADEEKVNGEEDACARRTSLTCGSGGVILCDVRDVRRRSKLGLRQPLKLPVAHAKFLPRNRESASGSPSIRQMVRPSCKNIDRHWRVFFVQYRTTRRGLLRRRRWRREVDKDAVVSRWLPPGYLTYSEVDKEGHNGVRDKAVELLQDVRYMYIFSVILRHSASRIYPQYASRLPSDFVSLLCAKIEVNITDFVSLLCAKTELFLSGSRALYSLTLTKVWLRVCHDAREMVLEDRWWGSGGTRV